MIHAQPSRTALRVAMRRAAHQIHDAEPRVLNDPLALRILPADARAELQRTPHASRKPYSAAIRAFMVCRARLAEDVLAEGVHQVGIRQALILGAGLDTFAYRNPFPHVRVFEVDHPATQAWKRDLLSAAAIAGTNFVTYVPVDFERQSLHDELLRDGFDPARPTATAWLGVVPYLTPEAFAATARVLSSFASGSSIIFDYSLPRDVLPFTEQLMHDSLSARVAQAGEPFRLFFTPESLCQELARCGVRVVQDLDSHALNARYFASRTDGLHLRGRAGRICHAVVAAQRPCATIGE